ncbi:MAG: ribosomal L7Ae/L30e/S12e/Gadd45 family protein [Atribacterota bacterium]
MGLEELKYARKVVGLRATEKAIQRGKAKKVYLAMDVEKKIRERIESLAKERRVEVEYVDLAETLGRVCGIEVASSCAALLDFSESNQENASK